MVRSQAFIPISWSQNPKIAAASHASNLPQHDMGEYLGLHIAVVFVCLPPRPYGPGPCFEPTLNTQPADEKKETRPPAVATVSRPSKRM